MIQKKNGALIDYQIDESLFFLDLDTFQGKFCLENQVYCYAFAPYFNEVSPLVVCLRERCNASLFLLIYIGFWSNS